MKPRGHGREAGGEEGDKQGKDIAGWVSGESGSSVGCERAEQ